MLSAQLLSSSRPHVLKFTSIIDVNQGSGWQLMIDEGINQSTGRDG